MAIEVNFGTPLKDMDVGFSIEDLQSVKVYAIDANGFRKELEYDAEDVPAQILTDLEEA